jgi:CHAD domain-containing protein
MMAHVAQTYIEREDKYDVPADFRLPDLAELVPLGGRLTRVDIDLRAMYYDTTTGDLLAARVTLRRREGGEDAGWHLKLPTGAARTEIQFPLGDSVLPAELTALTFGLRRGRAVQPIAVLRTQRTAHRIYDESGAPWLEIADDLVHSIALGSTAVFTTWREVEVELGTADEAVLTRATTVLAKAGANSSSRVSKLAQALTPVAGVPEPPSSGPKKATLGRVVLNYLLIQRAAILEGDLALRQGHDAIHVTRVATRRLRSTLRVFGDVFHPDQAAALDALLQWYAGVLGEVRDRDVLRARFRAQVEQLPADVREPVATAIDAHLVAARARYLSQLREALDSDRYLSLLVELDEWAVAAPFTAAAGKPAGKAGKRVKQAERALIKKFIVARRTDDDADLHSARKAGKRARYSAELATPIIGRKQAQRTVERFTELQDALGEFQDSVVAAALLRTLGDDVDGDRSGYDLLGAQEAERGRRSRKRAAKLMKR